MPSITQITRQKRFKNRVSVFIDEEFAFGIEEDQVYLLNLHVGDELTEERLDEIGRTVLFSSAKRTAQRYLARSMRTEKEVRKRLLEKEYPEPVILATIEWLKKYSFVNDKAYSEAYIQTQIRLKPASRRKLLADLVKKGIDKQSAEIALSESFDDDADANTALALARSYASKNSHIEEKKMKQRLMGYLQRRGFRYNDIREAIDKLGTE
jgi:regulatory protein